MSQPPLDKNSIAPLNKNSAVSGTEENGVWIIRDTRTWFQTQATEVLKKGPIPRHVAFILDGNRTFARSTNMKSVQGHKEGANTLANVFSWCCQYGVKEVTAYIFSIENFKRPRDQLNDLMRLAKESFLRLLNEIDDCNERGIRIRIIGDWSMIPKGMLSIMARIMALTKHNTKSTLNVAFAYTGRNEITRTAIELQNGVAAGELGIDDLNVNLMDETLKIGSSQEPLDLLVRTSGVTRLSDFMLWQQTFTILHFSPVLWPEFGFWDMWKAIFDYQVQARRMNKHKIFPEKLEKERYEQVTSNSKIFLQNVENKYWDNIEIESGKLL